MTNPEFQLPVPEVVQKATKSIVATITTVTGVLTLFGLSIADGSLSWTEGGTLIGAVATAVATVAGVWRVPNEVVSVTAREGA